MVGSDVRWNDLLHRKRIHSAEAIIDRCMRFVHAVVIEPNGPTIEAFDDLESPVPWFCFGLFFVDTQHCLKILVGLEERYY